MSRHSSPAGSLKGSGSRYILDHLATFIVSKEANIRYPADGMRRLRQLKASNEIWAQKMHLSIKMNSVLIMDAETGDIMDKFPLELVQEPTAFAKDDPSEDFNNVLVFIVREDRSSDAAAEMHLFQVLNAPAYDIVEEFRGEHKNGLDRGKTPPYTPSHPSPATTSPNEHVFVYSSAVNKVPLGKPDHDDSDDDDGDHVATDITTLNYCLTDIDQFTSRLEHVISALKELERRRNRRSSKRSGFGDGMLTIRSKIPAEIRFIESFQKLKLGFNLMAKLKTKIHDPNFDERVVFLLKSVFYIHEQLAHTHYGLAITAEIISPLLSADALNLVMESMTDQEMKIWKTLGDSWQIPRHEWKSVITPYQPVFMDGWSPGRPVDDELKNSQGAQGRKVSNEPDKKPQPRSKSPEPSKRASLNDNKKYESHVTGRSRFDQEQIAFLEELTQKNAKIVKVNYPRIANNDYELSVMRGEYLEVLDDTKKWYSVRTCHGKVGHVPYTIVAQHQPGRT